jgi:exosortase
MVAETGNRRLLVLSLFPSLLLMVWLVSRAQWFWTHKPDLQFGWIVCLLCLYCFWESWETKPPLQLHASLPGVLLVVAGLGILFYAQIYQAAFGVTTEGMSALGIGAIFCVFANLAFVFGRKGVLHFAFAFLLLLVALPIPETVYYPLVAKLQALVAAANVEILRLVGVPAVQLGSTIRLPRCVVGIDEACSGVRSLQSAVMATVFLGHLILKRRSLKAALFIGGVALAMIGNLGRSLFLSSIAYLEGPEVLNQLHDTAGWSILAFTAGGIGVLAWLFKRFDRMA